MNVNNDFAVRFESVGKRFSDVVALHEISLSVRRGELITLLGPSGCGKTTLLNMVAGFFSPDGGRILIDGRIVNDVPPYKREISMMFQSYALFPHMTVAGNVGYGLKMRHLPKAELERRVRDALSLVKLTGLQDRKPRQLSGGQQQRVALARALVINPKVLLLDEPFSALDTNLRVSMQVELREIQRKLGVTTIFVTHDQSEALSLSDRIAVMSEGRLRQVGTPQEIYSEPCDRFVASFIGDANVLRGRLLRVGGAGAVVLVGSAEVTVSAAPLNEATSGDEVDVFVRAEQLQIVDSSDRLAAAGRVAAEIYQGDHFDLYIECENCVSGRLLVRVPDCRTAGRSPLGTEVTVSVAAGGAVAFPAASNTANTSVGRL